MFDDLLFIMNNKAQFTKNELEVIFGGENIHKFNTDFTAAGISIDSRTIAPGNIFIAIKGERFDGHDKAAEAFEKGASAAVVNGNFPDNYPELFEKYPFIVVNDTIDALGRLASFHRNRFDIPIIAIGGSNGKTTTKNMTAALLSQRFNVLETFGNFNNRIGVPLMLFQLNEKHEIAVLEIGTNEPGEISVLSEMVKPSHGLITNIGREHIEKLIDIRGVEIEETYLFGYLHKTGGTCFVNIDDPRLRKYLHILENFFTFGTDEADLHAVLSFDETLKPILSIKTKEFDFIAKPNAYGYSSALNAVAAAAAAVYFGLTEKQIIDGFKNFRQDTSRGYGRMSLENAGVFLIINDCYNSNPESLALALRALKDMECKGKKIAVLGDMLELGSISHDEHIAAIDNAEKAADIVFLFGDEMKKAFDRIVPANNVLFFNNKRDISSAILEMPPDEHLILVKGSRGMKLEQIVNQLKKE